MKHRFEAFQFLSRKTSATTNLGVIHSSPEKRGDIHFEMEVRVEPKPFEIVFAQLKAQAQSIGFHQWIDPYIDNFLSRRWPMCLSAHGEVEVPEKSLEKELRKKLLTYPRVLLWNSTSKELKAAIPDDQRAHRLGYRRQYFGQQIFDIDGNRRPSTQAIYSQTALNEPTGPGVITFLNWIGVKDINEFVWSPILPFPNPTTIEADKPAIKRALNGLQKHNNSYSEFTDAERYFEAKDVKACVRSAAPSVDAILRYYMELWGQNPPPSRLAFDEKIDNVLQQANLPTYSVVNPDGAKQLRYLYRCRNSMHEGDCYFKDNQGNRIEVREIEQLSAWIKTVEEFTVWIDSVV